MKLLNDSLYRLIHSLSVSERTQFKKHAIAQRSSGDAAYLVLFDNMVKQKKYDAETIRKKMEYAPANIAEAKRYLYSALIDFLVKNKLEDYYLVDRLNLLHNEARVLYQQGLFQEAFNILQEAKEMAYKYEYFNQLLELIDFELTFIRVLYKENYYQYTEKARQEKSIAIQNINICDCYNAIFVQIHHYLEKNSSEENVQFISQLNKLMESDELVNVDISLFPFFAKSSYLRSFAMYYNIINNVEKEYEYHIKLLELWNTFTHMKNKYGRLYYVWLVNYLNFCVVFKNFQGLSILLKEISDSSTLKSSKKDTLLYRHNYLALKCRLYAYSGNFTESLKYATLVTQLSTLEKKSPYIYVMQMVLSYLGISIVHFISANYREANLYLNKMEGHYVTFSKTRMDIVSKLKIMQLLIRLTEGNLYLFQSQYETNKIFFHRNRGVNVDRIETIFMDFFKGIHKGEVNEIPERLMEFKDELLQKKLDRLVELYISFDFIAWIDSYVNKIPMEDIMREKASKEYPEVLSINF